MDIRSTYILKMIEDHGIIVNVFDFNTSRVDSLTLLTEDMRPVIFLNDQLQGDKQRFSLAYELGQYVMHSSDFSTANPDAGGSKVHDRTDQHGAEGSGRVAQQPARYG